MDWSGLVGIFAAVATLNAGVGVAYVDFSPSLGVLGIVLTVTWAAWLVIGGIYMREKRW